MAHLNEGTLIVFETSRKIPNGSISEIVCGVVLSEKNTLIITNRNCGFRLVPTPSQTGSKPPRAREAEILKHAFKLSLLIRAAEIPKQNEGICVRFELGNSARMNFGEGFGETYILWGVKYGEYIIYTKNIANQETGVSPISKALSIREENNYSPYPPYCTPIESALFIKEVADSILCNPS